MHMLVKNIDIIINKNKKKEKTNENWYKGIDSETLSYAMGYGRGNNFYCGD
mgnify:CR=1 FL=1